MLMRIREPVVSFCKLSNISAGDLSCRLASSVTAPISSSGSTRAEIRANSPCCSICAIHPRRSRQASADSRGCGPDAGFDRPAASASIDHSPNGSAPTRARAARLLRSEAEVVEQPLVGLRVVLKASGELLRRLAHGLDTL